MSPGIEGRGVGKNGGCALFLNLGVQEPVKDGGGLNFPQGTWTQTLLEKKQDSTRYLFCLRGNARLPLDHSAEGMG